MEASFDVCLFSFDYSSNSICDGFRLVPKKRSKSQSSSPNIELIEMEKVKTAIETQKLSASFFVVVFFCLFGKGTGPTVWLVVINKYDTI